MASQAKIRTLPKEVIVMYLEGHHICLATSGADFEEKHLWSKRSSFRDAQRKWGLKMAFEWKGPLPSTDVIETLRAERIYWGIHLPNGLAGLAHNNAEAASEKMVQAALLQPDYVVMHGGPSDFASTAFYLDDLNRLRSPIGATEYKWWAEHHVRLLQQMVAIMKEHGNGEVLFENTSPTEFSIMNGDYTLPTYCFPRAGNWVETASLARLAGAEPLCDVGHLQFALNYFWSRDEYAGIPHPPEFVPQTLDEFWVYRALGLGIRQGEYLQARCVSSLNGAIRAFNSRHFHLDGSTRESTLKPVNGKLQPDSHAPLNGRRKRDREIVGRLCQIPNLMICPEVDGKSGENGPFDWRSDSTIDAQAKSFDALCRMWTNFG